MAHCRHGADPVALLEVVDRLLSQLGRQFDLEYARLGAHLDGEARVAEHLKHPAVGGMHPRHEGHDATGLRELSEVRQQQGGDARFCQASTTAKASSARSRVSGTKHAWATTVSSGPATATRPVPRSTSVRAARSSCGPARGSETTSRPATSREGRRQRPPRLRGRSGAGGWWSRHAGRRRCRRRSRLTRWPVAVRRPWSACREREPTSGSVLGTSVKSRIRSAASPMHGGQALTTRPASRSSSRDA